MKSAEIHGNAPSIEGKPVTRNARSRRQRPHFPRARRISEEEALVEYRYGSVRILRDGRVRFNARTIPGVPELDFSVHYGKHLGGGSYVYAPMNPTICARWPGNPAIFMLTLEQGRVLDACFNFGLSPDELRRAVALLRRAGNGLERWIAPGLEWTQHHMTQGGGRYQETLKVIPKLLKSIRDLPVAEQWKQRCGDWKK